jgi:glycosyltransferase 2 family protein
VSATLRAWGRVVASMATLAVVLWVVGTGPFLDGIRAVDARALIAAAAIAVVTTVCCAWRWTIVARGLGVELPLRAAVLAYYRSLFLNLTLPGGVVGDVHRGISHGREVSDVGRALRAVAWERLAGQVVQAALTAAVLLLVPSPVHPSAPLAAGAVAVAACAALLLARAPLLRAVTRDIRDGLLANGAWRRITFASAVVVCGHVLTFVIAARSAGVSAPASQLLPLALLAMLGMVLPSLGGWGPREGATAWAFAAAGLDAAQGVETAVVYGVMAFVASLPGAAVLALAWWRPAPAEPPLSKRAAHA